jgi:myo-inositol 2-dehydrogenase / D-chiro-inositol 1-dehydrogenase
MALTQTALPVRVGIIGCGAIAHWAHFRTLRRLRGAMLVAAADPDPTARARAARMVRGPVHSLSTDLLRSEVDAVVISAPNPFHAELAIAAAHAGKHVYIEKPIATTADDARAVAGVVARSNLVATVGFNFRHHPGHQRARTLIKNRRIGAVRAVQTVFCEPMSPDAMPEWKRHRRSGGGALFDLASHHIDLVRWLLEDEVAVVAARIASSGTEHDSATLTLTTCGGIDVQMFVSFRAARADFLEIVGERGTLRVDRYALVPVLKEARRFGYGVRSAWLPPAIDLAPIWLRRMAQPSYQPSFRRALAAFIQRIAGQAVQIATIEDGERNLAVILAAEESARRNTPVAVP